MRTMTHAPSAGDARGKGPCSGRVGVLKSIVLASSLVSSATFATTPQGSDANRGPVDEASSVRIVQADAAAKVDFNIPKQSLADALAAWSRQSGLQVLRRDTDGADVTASSVTGKFSPAEALEKMLAATGLAYEFVNDRTVRIAPVGTNAQTTSYSAKEVTGFTLAQGAGIPATGAQESQASSGPPSGSDTSSESRGVLEQLDVRGIPEILIRGRRSLNADLRRDEDDVQPYVVFDREAIERSQAPDIESFLKTRLPMNAAQGSVAQQTNGGNGASTIQFNGGNVNLRGLGTNQTLILVDGRRVPGIQSAGVPQQTNINGIPLASIERIEVLPSTASAIYGGGATGGVINIIRKQDYSGVNLSASFGDTFDSGARSVQISGTGGFSFEDGRTQLTISASHGEDTPLYVVDRDFAARSRKLTFANNPDLFTNRLFSSPPLGATPNVCAATMFFPGFSVCNGMPLTLKDGGASLGSSFTSVPIGYAGPDSDGAAALVANAGTYNLDIPDDGQFLLRQPTIQTASLNLRREFGSRFTAYIDGYGDRNEMDAASVTSNQPYLLPASSPDNPFEQDILSTFPMSDIPHPASSRVDTLRLSGGLIVRLPHYWSAQLEYGWGRSRSRSGYTLFATHPADEAFLESGVLRDLGAFPLDAQGHLLPPDQLADSKSVLSNTSLRASGPIAQLPGGALALSTLIEHRKERAPFEYFQTSLPSFGDLISYVSFYPSRYQTVASGYLEARAPLISNENALPWVRELELQASVRHDRYKTVSTEDVGFAATRAGPFAPAVYSTNEVSSTDYLLGLRFSPVQSLVLRASVGSGFLPPSLSQIGFLSFPLSAADLPLYYNVTGDSRRGGTPITGDANGFIENITGGNPDLRPEESKSWSAGIILTPSALPGLRWSVDYTKIEKTDEITNFADIAFVLAHEADYPGRVIRGPNLPGDDPGWAGPILSIDSSALNLSSSSVEAYDSQLDYVIESARFGRFRPYVIATLATQFERQVLPTTPLYDVVGYSDGGPLEWRANAGLDWERGRWGASWAAQYFDSYSITYADPNGESLNAQMVLNQGTDRIPSQMYHDLQIRFRFGDDAPTSAALAGTEISLGIHNVFNHSPPIVASFFGDTQGGYSQYGDPRLRRFMLTVRKQFGLR
jgi:iron complex outermembrane receptor protein